MQIKEKQDLNQINVRMKNNLRITNVVCTGRLPKGIIPKGKKHLDNDIILKKSKYYCQINNEEICPILAFKFPRENGLTVHHKKKSICVSIWSSGSANIVGVLSLEEAQEYYDKVVNEIKRIMQEINNENKRFE